MTRTLLLTVAVVSLAACNPGVPITSEPVQPIFIRSSQSLQANQIQVVEVRAFQGRRQELSGVGCEVSSPYYTVDVVTPARVSLPSYAEATPTVMLSCTNEGETRTIAVEPFNETVGDRTSRLGGGLLVYAIVEATTNDENSVFNYPTLSIDFEG